MRTNDTWTRSTTAPIDMDTAFRYLKGLSTDEDDLIESWIQAAAEYWEEQAGRSIMIGSGEFWLDGFPVERKIEIPRPPLVEVTAVEYLNADGDWTSFSDGASPETVYWQSRTPAGIYARRGWIEPIDGQSWPIPLSQASAVKISYRAGYASTPSAVPELIKATLLRLVASFDQFRSDVHLSEGGRLDKVPFGVDQMIDPFKWSALPTQVLHWS